jgi:hypothetical protein
MTIKELKNRLELYPDDLEVVRVNCDSEYGEEEDKDIILELVKETKIKKAYVRII